MTDLGEVVRHCEVLVIGNAAPIFRTLPEYWQPGQIVLDLARIPGLAGSGVVDYKGITW